MDTVIHVLLIFYSFGCGMVLAFIFTPLYLLVTMPSIQDLSKTRCIKIWSRFSVLSGGVIYSFGWFAVLQNIV